MDYLTPTLGETNTILLLALLEGVTFDFKHGFLHMLENNLFSGVAYEDPMQHLSKFIKLTNMVRKNYVAVKYIRLYAFPFSLNEKAWDWLCSLPKNGITTWNQCKSAFLRKYFSPIKIDQYIKDNGNFVQRKQKSLP
ncbi:uncharacterized protein LOC114410803 [Glycine soja]|uniref:uncharacterized protein n=1 Tax=Glycine max TaxID=3847 RepID=UPI00071932F7|nr:uncharacterized protein LOC106799510 [Glycine max]XP_028230549.1 uncharacterized protein LOC114410803 [Glycine soja]|eukprot:XP_014633788.1 uncharacterized protein LOC106799510 [Glycine max]